jgi:hypothetical protein
MRRPRPGTCLILARPRAPFPQTQKPTKTFCVIISMLRTGPEAAIASLISIAGCIEEARNALPWRQVPDSGSAAGPERRTREQRNMWFVETGRTLDIDRVYGFRKGVFGARNFGGCICGTELQYRQSDPANVIGCHQRRCDGKRPNYRSAYALLFRKSIF